MTGMSIISDWFTFGKNIYNEIGSLEPVTDPITRIYWSYISYTQYSGSPKYMAPEVMNSRKYDTKADIL
jgi:serine/threonine protein kinase